MKIQIGKMAEVLNEKGEIKQARFISPFSYA